MSDAVYYILGGALILGVLLGIRLMSRVETARRGNLISLVCAAGMIALELLRTGQIGSALPLIVILLASIPSVWIAGKIKMLNMPQTVALFNGLGGLSSALVALTVLAGRAGANAFDAITAGLALAVGMITLSGSLVAAGKLARRIPQKSIVIKGHTHLTALLAVLTVALCALSLGVSPVFLLIVSTLFGVVFTLRVGGADMPITISLLNSLSGVAGGVAGIAVGNPVLICMGGVVGASGLLLTQIMCKAMNRSLTSILVGRGGAVKASGAPEAQPEPLQIVSEAETAGETAPPPETPAPSLEDIVRAAKDVIIIPGYGMALSQAQTDVKQLADAFMARGANVRFAVHPVAGRMPGHMNVLLCEADVPYDMLFEMDDINPDFETCDLAIAVGANDTINPAANTAEGTPIYGMPVLDVGKADHLIICNMDDKPGYAGVPNPLYEDKNTVFLAGDAKESLRKILEFL